MTVGEAVNAQRCLLASAAFLAGLASPAIAQPSPGSAGGAGQGEDIVVTGVRVPDSVGVDGDNTLVKDVPQAVSVITEELFDVQRPLSLTDIVRNTPGISNFRNGSETFRTLSVRGFVQNETTVDGLRNTDALNIQPDGLATIERVEVLRGPASALYGRGSLGASINIVTHQPRFDPGARIDLTTGDPAMIHGVGDLTGRIAGPVAGRFIAAYEDRESFIDFIDVEAVQVAPSLAIGEGDTRALIQVDYREREQLRYVGLPLYGTIRGLDDLVLPVGANFGEPGIPPTENTGLQVTTSIEQVLAPDWTLRVAGRFTRNTYLQEAVGLRTLGADNRTLARNWNRFDEAQREYSAFAILNGEVATGGVQHDLRAELEYARFSYDSDFFSGSIAPINIANPVYGARPAGIFLLDDTTDRISGFAVSLQDRVTLTPRFKVLLGGRLDFIDTRRRSNITGDAGQRDVTAFSPRLGATYDLIDSVTLYGSWGRNIESQNNGGSNATLTPFEPVRGEQFDVGIKLSRNERVAATLSLFQIEATGVLTADPNSFFSIQTGERRSRGVEFEVNWQPVRGLTLLGYLTYIDAEITADTDLPRGTPIENVPDFAARLFGLYEFAEGPLAGFSINAAITHQGAQPGNLALEASRFIVPESTIVDAGVSYRIGDVRLAVQARNLFDERHFIRGAFDGRNIVPGEPLTVFVSVGFDWSGG